VEPALTCLSLSGGCSRPPTAGSIADLTGGAVLGSTLGAMNAREPAAGRSGVRVDPRGEGSANVETGLPVLDSLLERLAEYASFDLSLEVEPGAAEAEVAEAGSALGRALAGPLRAENARGYGSAVMTSAEALATVVLEVTDAPLLVSNVDLTQARIGGLGTDVARRFLERFAREPA
jgi:imidazoleglycerol-phosphate dehydratase